MVTFFKSTFSRSLFLFRKAPFLILLVQLPEVSVDWWDRIFRDVFEAKPLVGAVTLFPYFILSTAVSSALTAIVGQAIAQEQRPALGKSLVLLGSRAGNFLKASLLCGVFIVVGMPVLLPAVYFMTVYLFVPLIAVFDAPAPAFSILARSKNLAKLELANVLAFTVFFLLVGLALSVIRGELEKLMVIRLKLPLISGAIAESVFTLALGAMVNLGSFAVYEDLILKRNKKNQALTQKIILPPNS